MRVRYPRTPHLPWSPGATADDVRLVDLEEFEGREVVVTEKLDGENTTLYRDGLHARSPDSAHHPSRAWVKALHGRIASRIPDGWRVSGENMFARHSIAYGDLDSWFYAFSVWDETDRCLDWDATVRFTRELGVPVPHVLYRGTFDAKALRKTPIDTATREGYVMRTVAGFRREHFGSHVAKWVRASHVQTDEHWMRGPVVENPRGARAALWDERSGLAQSGPSLLDAVGLHESALGSDTSGAYRAMEAAQSSLEVRDRRGDARLEGVLAALLSSQPRGQLAARIVSAVGMRTARRVADLVGLQASLHRYVPDETRRPGLSRMARAVDLGVLHCVAYATLSGETSDAAHEAREHVEWSELVAAEAGLLEPRPYAPLARETKIALAGLDARTKDRSWSEALELWAQGRLTDGSSAVAATFRFRERVPPSAVITVGLSGSGKSTFVADHVTGHRVVSLDDLRAERGDRADQSANDVILRDALGRFERQLVEGADVVWDATSLAPRQRSLPLAAASRRGACTTAIVFVVPVEELEARNASRGAHRISAGVLSAQLERFWPPFPGEADRILYVGPRGTIEDRAGSLDDED
jgi:predicted kinase